MAMKVQCTQHVLFVFISIPSLLCSSFDNKKRALKFFEYFKETSQIFNSLSMIRYYTHNSDV